MLQSTQSNPQLNSNPNKRESRRYPRLKIDLGNLVELDFKTEHPECIYLFKGLIIDSSLGGCGLIVVNHQVDLLEVNKTCSLKIPEVNQNAFNITTKIVWSKEIEKDIVRLGLEFID